MDIERQRREAERGLLELWQTEWCPSSHRVRQRLTELALPFVARQVPAAGERRAELREATGVTTIPVLVDGDRVICGSEAIIAYLDEHFAEPPDADSQREKAAMIRRRDLREACGKLSAAG